MITCITWDRGDTEAVGLPALPGTEVILRQEEMERDGGSCRKAAVAEVAAVMELLLQLVVAATADVAAAVIVAAGVIGKQLLLLLLLILLFVKAVTERMLAAVLQLLLLFLLLMEVDVAVDRIAAADEDELAPFFPDTAVDELFPLKGVAVSPCGSEWGNRDGGRDCVTLLILLVPLLILLVPLLVICCWS